jgi:hypothetical protein
MGIAFYQIYYKSEAKEIKLMIEDQANDHVAN